MVVLGLKWALDFGVASRYTSLVAVSSLPAAKPATSAMRIELMDGTVKSLLLPDSTTIPVADLVDHIGAKIGLASAEEYGLQGVIQAEKEKKLC